MELYALVDRDALDKKGISLEKIIQRINTLKAPILQYRAKNLSTKDRIRDLQIISSFYSGKIIINDDINAISYCDGLHIGQDDIKKFNLDYDKAIKIIREKIGHKLLGLSTHNLLEIVEANALDLDYIGLGAYRATTTKKDVNIKGDNLLKIAKHSEHKVALIGGVKLNDKFDNKLISYRVVGSDLYRKGT